MELEIRLNKELEAEIKKKTDLNELIEKQLSTVPAMMAELMKTREEVRRGREQKKEVKSAAAAARAAEKESLIQKLKAQDKELEQLRQKISNLKLGVKCPKASIRDHGMMFHIFSRLSRRSRRRP